MTKTAYKNASGNARENRLLDAALEYAANGWRVMPVWWVRGGECACRKGAKCEERGKHPILKDWRKLASIDPHKIRSWWAEKPFAGVGIVTGGDSGLVVLDVDPKNGGQKSLDALEAEHGPLPDAPQLLTGGGGLHVYFLHPGGKIRNRVGWMPGLDIRGDGGFVVAPPTIHSSGTAYRWTTLPLEYPPAPMPGWLLSALSERVIPSHSLTSSLTHSAPVPTEIDGVVVTESSSLAPAAASNRNATEKQQDRDRLLAGLDEEVCEIIIRTQPEHFGLRNDRLFRLARGLKVRQPDADPKSMRPIVEVWHALAIDNIRTKPFDDTFEDFLHAWSGVTSTKKTIEIAFAAAESDPVPAFAEQYPSRSMKLLIRVCRRLQNEHPNDWYVSVNDAAKFLGITVQSASARFQTLVRDGVLAVVKEHTSTRARRYRYHEPPPPSLRCPA